MNSSSFDYHTNPKGHRQRGAILLLLMLVFHAAISVRLYAGQYYVAPSGSNNNPGTRDKPFATVQKAADTMHSGDVCWIRGGTYRETISVKGEAKNNIAFQSLPGEVVIISGTELVEGEWQQHKDSIYVIDVDQPVRQVFVDGAMMTYARWPNATFKDRWTPRVWRANESLRGTVSDAELAKSGIDWTGAVLTLNTLPSWNKYTAIVERHGKGTKTLRYTHDKLWTLKAKSKKGARNRGYYLSGMLDALDAPEEWFYDKDTGKLYLCLPDGANPRNHKIEAKVRNYGFRAEQSDHVTLTGLHFFACTFYFRESNHSTVDACHVRFPNVAYLLTELDKKSKPTVSTTMIGHHNTVKNSSVAYSPTHGLRMLGSYALVENNFIYDCNSIGSLAYAPLWMGNLEDNVTWEGALKYEGRLKETINGSVVGSTEPVRAKNGDDPDRAQPDGKCTARNNTICRSGNIVVAFYSQPAYTITYNHVYDGGVFVGDVSLIYTSSPKIRGTEIAYNWVHGCPKLAIRGDDQSRGITYHHNVTWDGMRGHITVKGEDNAVYNNTALTNNAGNHGININTWPEPDKPMFRKLWPRLPQQNKNTPVANNLTPHITRFVSTFPRHRPFSSKDRRLSNNWLEANPKSLLRDPDNYDFRPKKDSPLVDAGKHVPGITDGFVGKAPDIGAYEADGPLWKPGHQNSIVVSGPDKSGSCRIALAMPPVEKVTVSIAPANSAVPACTMVFDEQNWMLPQSAEGIEKGVYQVTAEGKEIKGFAPKEVVVK